MSSAQRYERVSGPLRTSATHQAVADIPYIALGQMLTVPFSQIANEDTDRPHSPPTIPNSPPPSFRSRNSSRSRRGSRDDQSEQERNLHDAFDAPSDSEDEDDDNARSQRRLIARTNSDHSIHTENGETQRIVTEIPVFAPTTTPGRVYGGGNATDGVFANLSAKPRPGDELEEKPPTYEQAAADATPPYWETTVLSPYSHTGNPDDVFVDGLLVGSMFSFIWNALISMSFQLIGFLLTYLLHTTHAAKHGSRAGLGITLVQFGFQMRYASSKNAAEPSGPMDAVPADPNSHDFDPNDVSGTKSGVAGLSSYDWLSYVLMIVGWFILIRAVTDFMRARRQEALVRSSPDRGLGTAVVAEGEHPESSV